MNTTSWMELIALGGIAGVLGQLARVIVGIRKLGADAAATGQSRNDLIEPARLLLSIAIGFTGGALAALVETTPAHDPSLQQIFAFAGAGYAGADFIEGAIGTFVPANTRVATLAPNTPAAVADDAYVG